MPGESDIALASWKKHEQSQGKPAKEKLAEVRQKHDPRARSANERLADVQARYEQDTDPQRKCLHANMITVSFITVIDFVLMVIGQILGFVFEDVGPIDAVLRSYMIVLCILGIFVELEWTKLANSKILKWWITRGMFYAFIGVLALQQNENTKLGKIVWKGDHATGAFRFVQVMPWIMIGVGGIYFFMGACCIQFFYSRQREDYEKRLEEAETIKLATSRYNLKPDIV